MARQGVTPQVEDQQSDERAAEQAEANEDQQDGQQEEGGEKSTGKYWGSWINSRKLFLGEKSGATNTDEKNTKGKENIEREEKPEKGIQDSNQEELEKRETKVWNHLTSFFGVKKYFFWKIFTPNRSKLKGFAVKIQKKRFYFKKVLTLTGTPNGSLAETRLLNLFLGK